MPDELTEFRAQEAATAAEQAVAAPAQAPAQPQKTYSDLLVRLISGFVYVAITLTGVLLGNIPCVIVLSLTAGVCAWEFLRMVKTSYNPNYVLGVAAAVCFTPAACLWHLMGIAFTALVLLVALLVWYVFDTRITVCDAALTFLGAVYTGALLACLILVRQGPTDPWGGVAVLIIFAGVWLNDGFAYLFGCKFGKHKMMPAISPKKSWEGFFAGLVGSVLVWLVMLLVPGVAMTWWQALVCGLVVGLMGVVGDLAESRIKRNFGVKDSGKIMPGHGGLLDRSDSILFAGVTAALLLIVFGCIPPVM